MNLDIRIAHVIDSLSIGGSERMAVNIVNGLSEQNYDTHLIVSRKEGPLKEFVTEKSKYCFLAKKSAWDIWAFIRFVRYLKKNKIRIVHAHSTSLAWAYAASFFANIKLIWHDHYGFREFLDQRNDPLLGIFLKRTSHIIAVNSKLVDWFRRHYHIPEKKICYLPNFPDLGKLADAYKKNQNVDTPVIVCLSNLREPKGHHLLVDVLHKIDEDGIKFKAFFIGKDYHDEYSKTLKSKIEKLGLNSKIDIVGARSDVSHWLVNADVGVLASSSEGLPVSLLEYGLAGLAVVCTRVGQCEEVLENGKYGILVQPNQEDEFYQALKKLLTDSDLRSMYGNIFQKRVNKDFSKQAVLKKLLNIYDKISYS